MGLSRVVGSNLTKEQAAFSVISQDCLGSQKLVREVPAGEPTELRGVKLKECRHCIHRTVSWWHLNLVRCLEYFFGDS
jgi:hypothetical protein